MLILRKTLFGRCCVGVRRLSHFHLPSFLSLQVSNTLLITDIKYKSGPGINTFGMPKGLALKMNKDEEVKQIDKFSSLPRARTYLKSITKIQPHRAHILHIKAIFHLYFISLILILPVSCRSPNRTLTARPPAHPPAPPPPLCTWTAAQASRKPCSEMCLYTREVYFYSSGIQHEVDVLSPEVYGVWTDGTCTVCIWNLDLRPPSLSGSHCSTGAAPLVACADTHAINAEPHRIGLFPVENGRTNCT